MTRPESISCPRCYRDAMFIVVRRYMWRKPDGSRIPVPNARVIKCSTCGELPENDREKIRWEALEWQERQKLEKGADPNEPQCADCGKPRSKTGQFFSYGYNPRERKHYCQDCNEKRHV